MIEKELNFNDEETLFILKSELRNRTKYLWKCANEKVIDLKEMTDTHLINTIAKIEKYKQEKEEFEEAYSSYDYDF